MDAAFSFGERIVASRPGTSVTQLLDAAALGERAAVNNLWSAVYDELHRLAQAQLVQEGPGCALQPTALVDEAYLRLIGDGHVEWANRRHFFAAAAKAMRRILVDDARTRGRLRRGGSQPPDALPDELPGPTEDPAKLLAIDEAMQKLEQADPPRAELVMLRYFAGLSVDETAAALGVSARTVDTGWRFAKAWLHRELSKGDSTWCGRVGRDDAGADATGV
ncbi:MAG: sigma-70 family RNA polymerase sigma factor [Planctomycetes bacterium]|nr:sigma-70 family RNA polymerase sigma factor [Planctomycetota bacterium]